MWYRTFQPALCYPPTPCSLAANWVVIVIMRCCTCSEGTGLFPGGWSSVSAWAVEGSRSLSHLHSFYWVLFVVFFNTRSVQMLNENVDFLNLLNPFIYTLNRNKYLNILKPLMFLCVVDELG